ncbi:glycosyltransferase family 4 protein [Paracoccus sp. (in: a-proteobacteria)]|uniref:glycosyltransferase family 4 protein n=1 Tax=Paracoccus sp. TaxID=267 RepID=UPI00396C84CA
MLDAIASCVRFGRLVRDMIGDGPMLDALRSQVTDLQIADAVTFHGNLPHERVQDILSRANLFTFPSIRKFGDGVVLEAMALGVVPMVVDYAGPGELVSDRTGFLIPIGSCQEITKQLHDMLARVIEDPSELPLKGQAARAQVRTGFTWDAKAQQIVLLYQPLLQQRLR